MFPKRGPDGKYVDYYTNTLEDAAEFETHYNADPPRRRYGPPRRNDGLRPGDNCPECAGTMEMASRYELTCDTCEFTFEDESDKCGCSDPCCPCSGHKVGVP